MPRYPLGIPGSDDVGEADALLIEQQQSVRRLTGDPLVPPDDHTPDPFLVPRNLWDKVRADNIRSIGGQIAVTNDGGDLSFNQSLGQIQDAWRPRTSAEPRETIERVTPAERHEQFRRALVAQAANDYQAALQATQDRGPGPWAAPQFVAGDAAGPALSQDFVVARNSPQKLSLTDHIMNGVYERSAGALDATFSALGAAFDGKRQMQWSSTRLAAAALWMQGADYSESLAEMERRWQPMFDELPRAAQIVVEEASFGNAGMVIGSGFAAAAFKASGVRGGRVIGGLLEPFGGPTGFARETAAVALGRIGYEQTDGMNPAIRVAVAGAGLLLGGSPDSIIASTARGARTAITAADGRIVGGLASEAGGVRFPAWRAPKAGNVPGTPHVPGQRIIDPVPDVIEQVYPPASALDTGAPHRPAVERFTENGSSLAAARDWFGQAGEVLRPGLQHALERAPSLVGNVNAGILNRLSRLVNGATPIRAIREAYAAEGATISELSLRFAAARTRYLHEIRNSFGAEDLTYSANVAYTGSATRVLKGVPVPIEDFKTDGLTDHQRQLIGEFDVHNSKASDVVREEFGVDLGEFGLTPPGVPAGARPTGFVPIVNRVNTRTSGLDLETRAQAVTGRARERAFNSVADRLASTDLSSNFEPELNFGVLFSSLDDAKAMAAGREVFRAGVGGQSQRAGAVNATVDGLEGRFFTQEYKEAIDRVQRDLGSGLGSVFDKIDMIRQTRLNMDMSPLTIQGSLAWAASPRAVAGDMIRAIREGRFRASFSNQAFAEDMAARPTLYRNFAAHTGMRVGTGTPAEWSTEFISRLRLPGGFKRPEIRRGEGVFEAIGGVLPLRASRAPSVGQTNEALFNLVTRSMVNQFDRMSQMLIREGTPEEEAFAAAAWTVTRIVPMVNPRRSGVSLARARVERALATSVSFIRQPASFMAHAASGTAKLSARAVWSPVETGQQGVRVFGGDRLRTRFGLSQADAAQIPDAPQTFRSAAERLDQRIAAIENRLETLSAFEANISTEDLARAQGLPRLEAGPLSGRRGLPPDLEPEVLDEQIAALIQERQVLDELVELERRLDAARVREEAISADPRFDTSPQEFTPFGVSTEAARLESRIGQLRASLAGKVPADPRQRIRAIRNRLESIEGFQGSRARDAAVVGEPSGGARFVPTEATPPDFRRAPFNELDDEQIGALRRELGDLQQQRTALNVSVGGSGTSVPPAAQWARLTPEERMATQFFWQMQGTLLGLTAASAALTAQDRGESMTEAVLNNLDPRKSSFLKLQLPEAVFGVDVPVAGGLGIPLGGPYRGMARLLAPSDEWQFPAGNAVSIAQGLGGAAKDVAENVPGFFGNRMTPALATAFDLIRESDFFGEDISQREGWARLVDYMAFAGEQVLPLSVAAFPEAHRRGLGPDEAFQNFITEFMGTNATDASAFQQMQISRRKGAAIGLRSQDPEAWQAQGMTPEQAAAAIGASSYAELAERIGTRAANAFSEASSPDFEQKLEDYVADLGRRAARGDEVAQALLVGAETQVRLLAASQDPEIRTGASYRDRRADIMAEQRGKLAAFSDVFDNLRESTNVIDRQTAEYFDLFDAAAREDGTVDFDKFNDLESAFIAKVGAEQFALIEANAFVAPRGANDMELQLREDRQAITTGGFWEIEEEVWAASEPRLRNIIADAGIQIPDSAFSDYSSFRLAMVDRAEELIARQIETQGFIEITVRVKGVGDVPRRITEPEFARAAAESMVSSDDIINAIDADRQAAKRKWLGDPQNAEAAEAVIRQQYMSGKFNIGTAQDALDAAAESQPEPTSANIADRFNSGLTFVQLAEATGRSAAAIEQLLRREARKRGFANATEMRAAGGGNIA
jgi:hypothetical protein